MVSDNELHQMYFQNIFFGKVTFARNSARCSWRGGHRSQPDKRGPCSGGSVSSGVDSKHGVARVTGGCYNSYKGNTMLEAETL